MAYEADQVAAIVAAPELAAARFQSVRTRNPTNAWAAGDNSGGSSQRTLPRGAFPFMPTEPASSRSCKRGAAASMAFAVDSARSTCLRRPLCEKCLPASVRSSPRFVASSRDGSRGRAGALGQPITAAWHREHVLAPVRVRLPARGQGARRSRLSVSRERTYGCSAG